MHEVKRETEAVAKARLRSEHIQGLVKGIGYLVIFGGIAGFIIVNYIGLN